MVMAVFVAASALGDPSRQTRISLTMGVSWFGGGKPTRFERVRVKLKKAGPREEETLEAQLGHFYLVRTTTGWREREWPSSPPRRRTRAPRPEKPARCTRGSPADPSPARRGRRSPPRPRRGSSRAPCR